jgi:hypothetical protein
MNRVLLGIALAGAFAVPASAQSFEASGFSSLAAFGSSGSGHLRTLSGRPGGDQGNSGHRRHIHVGDGSGFGFGYGYGYYDGDYDANRSFDPDKWNDWWHDRPERAFPRWMSRNQDCARPWYSGNVLTC